MTARGRNHSHRTKVSILGKGSSAQYPAPCPFDKTESMAINGDQTRELADRMTPSCRNGVAETLLTPDFGAC